MNADRVMPPHPADPENASPKASPWPVVGHEVAIRLLRRGLEQGRLSHAYLFVGPDGVGKLTLARALAQALLCEAANPRERPCGQCRACRLAAQDRHPDVRLILPPEADRALSIEQIRELQHDASLSPVEGRTKIFLISDLDRATVQAANALLKTLEEPPPHVVLLLTATQPEALLPTVVSRCQVIPLRPLSIALVETTLRERWQASPEQAALWARLSHGCLGAAIAGLRDQRGSAWRQHSLQEMIDLLANGTVERCGWAEQMANKPDQARATLLLWLSWWRDVMYLQAHCREEIVNIDHEAALTAIAQACSAHEVCTTTTRIHKTLAYLEANANVRLALESLSLHLPRLQAPILENAA